MKIEQEKLKEIRQAIETATLAQAQMEAAQTRAKHLTLVALSDCGAALNSRICAQCGEVGKQGDSCETCTC